MLVDKQVGGFRRILHLLQSGDTRGSSRRRGRNRDTGLSPAGQHREDDLGDVGDEEDLGDDGDVYEGYVGDEEDLGVDDQKEDEDVNAVGDVDNEDLENLGPLQALVTSGSDVLISKNNCSERIFHK